MEIDAHKELRSLKDLQQNILLRQLARIASRSFHF
jgi:hypothetical protein